ncbi:NAD(P)H:quinone oxidoreductase [Paraburkholderia sp. IMGN_8]|uniref:NAD(P)H:quinone oxidoreductase n=1 Tax=Paraburkholderia sp. IMGN_8 TaxID=3136564 RepID=UPI00310133B8
MNMQKVAVIFYSRDGSTESLAGAIADGAKAAGAEVRVRRVREVVSEDVMDKAPGWREAAAKMNAKYEAPSEADVTWADAIIFGTPTRFGSAASELRAFIDSLGGLWFGGVMNGKIGSAFSSTSSLHGGNESTILSLYNTLAHLGMIIVPPGYADPVMFKAGTPYGATHASAGGQAKPDGATLEAARFQGKRVAEVARLLVTSTAKQ